MRSEEGKSGLTALRAPSLRIRHRAYGAAGYRHDSSLSFGVSKTPGIGTGVVFNGYILPALAMFTSSRSEDRSPTVSIV